MSPVCSVFTKTRRGSGLCLFFLSLAALCAEMAAIVALVEAQAQIFLRGNIDTVMRVMALVGGIALLACRFRCLAIGLLGAADHVVWAEMQLPRFFLAVMAARHNIVLDHDLCEALA